MCRDCASMLNSAPGDHQLWLENSTPILTLGLPSIFKKILDNAFKNCTGEEKSPENKMCCMCHIVQTDYFAFFKVTIK